MILALAVACFAGLASGYADPGLLRIHSVGGIEKASDYSAVRAAKRLKLLLDSAQFGGDSQSARDYIAWHERAAVAGLAGFPGNQPMPLQYCHQMLASYRAVPQASYLRTPLGEAYYLWNPRRNQATRRIVRGQDPFYSPSKRLLLAHASSFYGQQTIHLLCTDFECAGDYEKDVRDYFAVLGITSGIALIRKDPWYWTETCGASNAQTWSLAPLVPIENVSDSELRCTATTNNPEVICTKVRFQFGPALHPPILRPEVPLQSSKSTYALVEEELTSIVLATTPARIFIAQGGCARITNREGIHDFVNFELIRECMPAHFTPAYKWIRLDLETGAMVFGEGTEPRRITTPKKQKRILNRIRSLEMSPVKLRETVRELQSKSSLTGHFDLKPSASSIFRTVTYRDNDGRVIRHFQLHVLTGQLFDSDMRTPARLPSLVKPN